MIGKVLNFRDLHSDRRDTVVGAVLTQVIMTSMALALAATVGLSHPGIALNGVGEMSSALRPFLGTVGGEVLLGAALLVAGMVAALVASLAGA